MNEIEHQTALNLNVGWLKGDRGVGLAGGHMQGMGTPT